MKIAFFSVFFTLEKSIYMYMYISILPDAQSFSMYLIYNNIVLNKISLELKRNAFSSIAS